MRVSGAYIGHRNEQTINAKILAIAAFLILGLFAGGWASVMTSVVNFDSEYTNRDTPIVALRRRF